MTANALDSRTSTVCLSRFERAARMERTSRPTSKILVLLSDSSFKKSETVNQGSPSDVALRMIRRTNQWATLYMFDSFHFADFLVPTKLVRVNKLVNG